MHNLFIYLLLDHLLRHYMVRGIEYVIGYWKCDIVLVRVELIEGKVDRVIPREQPT